MVDETVVVAAEAVEAFEFVEFDLTLENACWVRNC
jgi:hypothetical protein